MWEKEETLGNLRTLGENTGGTRHKDDCGTFKKKLKVKMEQP